MMPSSTRQILLASATAIACLTFYVERACAQQVPICYPDTNFTGASQEVTSEAECRNLCAGSRFAAIKVKEVGDSTLGICRCGDQRPTGPPGGSCLTPCSGGGICGGDDVEALLEISIVVAPADPGQPKPPSLPGSPSRQPGAPQRTNSTIVAAPATLKPGVTGARRPPTSSNTRTAVSVSRETPQSDTAAPQGGKFPMSLLPIFGAALAAIIIVPFVVVTCLRYQRRRVNASETFDSPYNSTAKRLRPVSTIITGDSATFPEMRSSPSPLLPSSPVMSPYRLRPSYVPASPSTLSFGPAPMGYPAVVHSNNDIFNRSGSEASTSSFSSQVSQHMLQAGNAFLSAPQVAPHGYAVTSSSAYGSNVIAYDEVLPNFATGRQPHIYVAGPPHVRGVVSPFEGEFENPDGGFPPMEPMSPGSATSAIDRVDFSTPDRVDFSTPDRVDFSTPFFPATPRP